VDTQGLVLKARVHSAKIQDREGIKVLLDLAPKHLARLSHLWMDAGYTGEDKGADWVQRTLLGWTAQIVRHPPKMAPDEVMRRWVKEWDNERELRSIRRSSQGAEEVWGSASAMGGGAHVLVVGTEPPYEQGLRKASRNERGVRLRGYDALDGEAFSSLMRLFRQFPYRKVGE
jgi:transposase